MEKKKAGKAVLVCGYIWFFTLLVMAVYFFCGALLPEGMEYRAWLQIAGLVWSLLVMPVAFIIFLLCLLWKKAGAAHQGISVVLTVIGLILFVFYTFFAILAILFMSLAIGSETTFKEGIIVTEKSLIGPSSTSFSYQEDMGLFVKKEYEPMTDIVLLFLEKKYNEKFALEKEMSEQQAAGVQDGLVLYYVYPVKNPDRIFRVREVEGAFSDDYAVSRAGYIMEEALAEICPERKLTVSESDGLKPLIGCITIECAGKEDMEACAEDTAALIKKVLEDEFFAEEGRKVKLVVECMDNEGKTETAKFFFGNYRNGMVSGYAADYYTDKKHVYERLLQCFDGLAEQGTEKTFEEIAKEHEASPLYAEGAYKVLYDKLFADNGYAYDYDYNAKGNFYAFLCEGSGELESTPGTYDYTETIVYDRESKNGKCHLFVYYRTYYKDGEEFTTDILDMYAVDKKTGDVYASGRHAWEDVGSKEYCDATGEP
ncbi:MAG: hypothetical protein UFG06_05995 [Lachnospiraceae bacterium]|nr:hypothetical protein [Lachnospiraceae bacterium]